MSEPRTIIVRNDSILKKLKVFFSLIKKYFNANGINKKRKYVIEENIDLSKLAAQKDDKIMQNQNKIISKNRRLLRKVFLLLYNKLKIYKVDIKVRAKSVKKDPVKNKIGNIITIYFTIIDDVLKNI